MHETGTRPRETDPEKPTLRRATAADAAAIEAIHREAFFTRMPWMPDLHTPAEARDYFGGVVSQAEVWVAELGGRLLGFAALSAEMLDHLYVRPDAQGRGIGSALLDQAKERRPGGLSLWTFQANGRARAWYEARGFRPVAFTDGENEERQPDVRYEWRPDRDGS